MCPFKFELEPNQNIAYTTCRLVHVPNKSSIIVHFTGALALCKIRTESKQNLIMKHCSTEAFVTHICQNVSRIYLNTRHTQPIPA